MIVALYFAIMIIDLLCILLQKKSKLVFWANVVVFSLIFYGNIRTGWSDIVVYREQYNTQNPLLFSEPGYLLFSKTFSGLGLTFNQYLLVIFVLFMASILIFLKGTECNFAVFFFCMGLFYYFYIIEGIRYLLATTFLVIGCRYLIRRKNLVFILFLLISITFHSSFILFALLLFTNFKHFTRKFYVSYAVVFIAICALTVMNHNQIPLGNLIFGFISKYLLGGREIASFYNGSITATHSWMYIPIYYACNFGLLYASQKLLENARDRCGYDTSSLEEVYTFCFRANCLLALTLPFAMMSPTYFRFFFFVTLLIFLLLSMIFGTYYNSIQEGKRLYLRTNVTVRNGLFTMLTSLFVWTAVWWYVKPNFLNLFEILKMNMFY